MKQAMDGGETAPVQDLHVDIDQTRITATHPDDLEVGRRHHQSATGIYLRVGHLTMTLSRVKRRGR
jgi:hypothetical protein